MIVHTLFVILTVLVSDLMTVYSIKL